MSDKRTKQERCDAVNELIRVIGDVGRRFFHHAGNYTEFVLGIDNRIGLIDHFTRRAVETRSGGPWRGFTNGGTLRALCEDLVEFIRRGKRLPPWWVSYRAGCSDPYLFGDAAANAAVRDEAVRLGIVDGKSPAMKVCRLEEEADRLRRELAAANARADDAELVAFLGWINFELLIAMGIGKQGDTRPAEDIVASMFTDLHDELREQMPGGTPSPDAIERIRRLGRTLRAAQRGKETDRADDD